MSSEYQISAIALLAALMLAFAYLHLRFRSPRTFLWLLALACAELRVILVWLSSSYMAVPGAGILLPGTTPLFSPSTLLWMRVAGETAVMVSSVLFLASLSTISFRLGSRRVLYAIPYLIPLLAYSILYYTVSPGQQASGELLWVYCALAIWTTAVAFLWSLQKGAIPIWIAITVVIVAGSIAIPFFVHGNVYWPMRVVESGNMLMTALLVFYTYRRFSPGVILATGGFLAWALPPLLYAQTVIVLPDAMVGPLVGRTVTMGKIFVALGLVLLLLEEEVQKNQTAQRRERRVRLELEAYARQALTARSIEEFDRETTSLCNMIVEHSCFAGAAMLVRGISGSYTLVGFAGMDGATAGALDVLALRLPLNCFTESGSILVPGGVSIDLDLTPWLTPGDDLERLRLTRLCAIPMLGSDNSADGALLLTASRIPLRQLRADDLLPLEILAGRLQAARAQALILGKLIESERFAGVGQLATNVAQQLNNPLTVILGYAALLEESTAPGPDRRGAEAIVIEGRRMKGILERLSRFSRLSTERFSSFSIADLVSDIEQFHRTDFLRHSIEFRLILQPGLPNIFGNVHQIRQGLLHAMQFAIESVIRVAPNEQKAVRVEASSEEGRVLILIAHSGNGFPHPERAFDSLSSGFNGTEATGIGLSLCAAIVREHRGQISALNYEPSGAAILIELPLS
jgi:signal transduction histidine kinase